MVHMYREYHELSNHTSQHTSETQNAVKKIREQRKCPVVIKFNDYSKHKRDGDEILRLVDLRYD